MAQLRNYHYNSAIRGWNYALAKPDFCAQDGTTKQEKRAFMDDQTDLQDKANINPISRTRIVRTVVWNEGARPGIDPETGNARVEKIRTTTTGSNQQRRNLPPPTISFERRELDQILRVYSFKVADGEWKDYAIDMLKDRAVFSVFRRAHDLPLHCIEKIPSLARKQGQYQVTGNNGQILKRGHDLATVLKVLEKRPKLKVV